MLRFEREVYQPHLIKAMLDEMMIVNVGINDEDGVPYVVPLSFGFEMTDENLIVYTHFMKAGKKVSLFKRDPRVCLEFSLFNDFPDRKYKGHVHDFRSVIAKGTIRLLNYDDDPVLWEKGYNLLYTCNNREIKPLSSRKTVPNMYIGVITCPLSQVTAKSEFPIRTVEDVPFINVYEMEDDDTPFDLSDIIQDRRERMKKMKG